MEQKITKIQEQIQSELDKSRYEHTQGVMYTARQKDTEAERGC